MLIKFLRSLFWAPPKRPSFPPKANYLSDKPKLQGIEKPPIRHSSKETIRPANTPAKKQLVGKCYVIDGDTIVIDKTHIRLFGIDAPEMDQPYGKKAKWAMVSLTKGRTVTANLLPESSYDRVVAHCVLDDGTDLSAEIVKQGLALDWSKFSGGAYSEFETQNARKKLWRVAAKHRGKLPPGV